MPIAKAKRCRRTLAEMASPHTTISIQEPSLRGHGFSNLHADEYQLYQPSHLTVDQFCPNTVEMNSLALLQEDIFKAYS